MIDLVASAPARHPHCILLSADVAYHPFAFALIKQITDAQPDMAVDICLVSEDDIAVPPALKHLPIRLCRISVDAEGVVFPHRNHVNSVGYVWLFAATALAEFYDRILYLDADILFNGEDFSKLFDIELLPGHAIAAVRDRFQQASRQRLSPEAKKLQMAYFPYFNAGVVLVDAKAWLQQQMLDRVLQTIRDYAHGFTYTDQSALNLTLRGAWTELSWTWNWIYAPNVVRYLATVDPVFVHFAGSTKPWNPGRTRYPDEFITFYADFLADHYPDARKDGGSPAPVRRKRRPIKTFIRNLRAKSQIKTYSQRVQRSYDLHDPWA